MFIPELSLFFLHVPKMGGTSISKVFNRTVNGVDGTKTTFFRHKNLKECQKYCKSKGIKFPEIIFIVLRNRYEQIYSTWRWYFVSKHKIFKSYSEDEYSFNKYLSNIKLIHSCSSLSDCDFKRVGSKIIDKKEYIIADYRPIAKIDWWTNNDPNVIKLRLSNIQEDFNNKIRPLIKSSCEEIPHLNQNKKIKKNIITPEQFNIIEEIYGDEISEYSYSRPSI